MPEDFSGDRTCFWADRLNIEAPAGRVRSRSPSVRFNRNPAIGSGSTESMNSNLVYSVSTAEEAGLNSIWFRHTLSSESTLPVGRLQRSDQTAARIPGGKPAQIRHRQNQPTGGVNHVGFVSQRHKLWISCSPVCAEPAVWCVAGGHAHAGSGQQCVKLPA